MSNEETEKANELLRREIGSFDLYLMFEALPDQVREYNEYKRKLAEELHRLPF